MADDAKTNANPEVKVDVATPAVESAPLRGLIGTKIGMTRVFVDDTHMVPATVISTENVVVSQVKTKKTDGYDAVQVGYGDIADKKLNKPRLQHFTKKNLKAKRWLHEFRVDDPTPFKTGQVVPVTVFSKGDVIKVTGLTKGKGYAGVVKRYGFGGLPFSHGHGEYRNRPGSSSAQGPQHVLPGTKKPGHLGHSWFTAKNVTVVDVDAEKSLVLVQGSVPGPNGNFLVLSPAKRAAAKS